MYYEEKEYFFEQGNNIALNQQLAPYKLLCQQAVSQTQAEKQSSWETWQPV